MDSYLEIARKVLREVRQPLSAKQILRTAYQLQIVPRELYGRTQHKTLHARLSTDILNRRGRSEFYRTGPGRFFLRALRNDEDVSSRYRREYIAPLRAAQLGRFEVATVRRNLVERLPYPNRIPVVDLWAVGCTYRRMDEIRSDLDILALRLLVILLHEGHVLLRQRRPVGEGEIASRTGVGFEGVVRVEDRSLFSKDDAGLCDAALRTIAEWLEVAPSMLQRLRPCKDSGDFLVLYEVDGAPAADDLVLVISFDCADAPEVVDATRRVETLEWHPLPMRANDLDRFDRWSARLIADAALQSAVCH